MWKIIFSIRNLKEAQMIQSNAESDLDEIPILESGLKIKRSAIIIHVRSHTGEKPFCVLKQIANKNLPAKFWPTNISSGLILKNLLKRHKKKELRAGSCASVLEA